MWVRWIGEGICLGLDWVMLLVGSCKMRGGGVMFLVRDWNGLGVSDARISDSVLSRLVREGLSILVDVEGGVVYTYQSWR